MLKNATKTSFDDELTLLLAVGSDVPGDIQVVPAGEPPAEPAALATPLGLGNWISPSSPTPSTLHGIPGVQRKTSASMLTTPLACAGTATC